MRVLRSLGRKDPESTAHERRNLSERGALPDVLATGSGAGAGEATAAEADAVVVDEARSLLLTRTSADELKVPAFVQMSSTLRTFSCARWKGWSVRVMTQQQRFLQIRSAAGEMVEATEGGVACKLYLLRIPRMRTERSVSGSFLQNRPMAANSE